MEYFRPRKCKNVFCQIDSPSKDSDLVICNICADAFHLQCLSGKKVIDNKFDCKSCTE